MRIRVRWEMGLWVRHLESDAQMMVMIWVGGDPEPAQERKLEMCRLSKPRPIPFT